MKAFFVSIKRMESVLEKKIDELFRVFITRKAFFSIYYTFLYIKLMNSLNFHSIL
jgi:hypothetical protein